MRTVKNIENKDLEVSFNFWTYTFPKGKAVLVENDLADHLIEGIPLAFNFDVKEGKKPLTKVRKVKTTSFIGRVAGDGTEDMKITKAGIQSPTFAQADNTPPSGTTDKDGVGWYGPGLEVE